MADDANLKASLRKWYTRALILVVAAFVAWVAWTGLHQGFQISLTFRPALAALCLALIIIGFFGNFLVWYGLSGAFGLKTGLLAGARVWFISQLGRYVPGKITLLMVRWELTRDQSKKKVAVVTGLEYITALAGGCLLVLLAVATAPAGLPEPVRWTAAGLAAVLLIVLYPPILKRLTALGFRAIKREPLAEFPRYTVILGFVAANVLVGLIHGLSFFVLLNALTPLGPAHYLTVTGAYYGASLIGIAAVFAPSGLGVKEGVLYLALAALVPKEAAAVAAVAVRLLTTAAELSLAGIFWLIGRNK